jgi:hypothetical protein
MKKILILTVFSVAIFFNSCTDLEPKVFSDVLKDDYYKTPEQFATLLANAYSQLAGELGYVYREGYWSLQQYTTDEVAVPTRGVDWFDNGVPLALQQHTWNFDTRDVQNGWAFAYGGVTKCNDILHQIAIIKGTDASHYDAVTISGIAETKVLRAFYHFLAMDLYGNVPIAESSSATLKQFTRKEVYDFIEKEIQDNLEHLRFDISYGKVTRSVAEMMLAKLYLNAQVYTGTPQWQKCLDMCNAILESGYGYRLESDYFNVFSLKNRGSREIIFPVVFDAVKAPGNMFHLMTNHYVAQDAYNFRPQPWNGPCAHQALYDSYNDEDVRKAQWFVGPIKNQNGDTLRFDIDTSLRNQPVIIRSHVSATIDPTKRNSFDGARFHKFEIERGAGHHANNDFPIYRLADVYLMKAECLMRLNGGTATQDACDAANMIRPRTGLVDYTIATLTLDELLAERSRELAWEAHRRPDLLRFEKFFDDWGVYDWGTYKRHNIAGINRDIGGYSKLFPIPKRVMDAAPDVYKQNPGY